MGHDKPARERSCLSHPWETLAPISLPVKLCKRRSRAIDRLVKMPVSSALTIARVDPSTGVLHGVDWRGTGEWGFYPASSVKLITAAMTLRFLDEYELPIDAVVSIGDDPPMSFRELLAETLVFSGNDTFNTLQETIGIADTYREMKRWGVVKACIRRHFKSPRYSHSRPATIFSGSGKALLQLPARPSARIPLHDGNGQAIHNRKSNWACTDDLVRCMAAILAGPTRHTRFFGQLTGWCGMTNRCYSRAGLRQLTANHPRHPSFVILNKPGWWPPDSANIDFGYIFDVSSHTHYLYAAYFHGTEIDAATGIADAFNQIFTLLHGDHPDMDFL